MIAVDSSVWIELLRDTGSPVQTKLEDLLRGGERLAITELVLAELLAGYTGNAQALRSSLLAHDLLPLKGLADFESAAALYRRCRSQGEELGGLADCLIAVPVMRAGARLLHNDKDFDAIARHSDLEVLSL